MSLTGSEIAKQFNAGNIHIEPYRDDQLNRNGVSYDVTLADELAILPLNSVLRTLVIAGTPPPSRASSYSPQVRAVMRALAEKTTGIEYDRLAHRVQLGFPPSRRLPQFIDPADPPAPFVFSMREILAAAAREVAAVSQLGQAFPLLPGILYLGSTREEIGSDVYQPHLHGKSGLGRLGVVVHKTAGFGEPGFKFQWTLEITVDHPTYLHAGMRIGQIEFEEVIGEVIDYSTRGSYGKQRGPTGSRMGRYFKDGLPV